jgi:hypothetical protein
MSNTKDFTITTLSNNLNQRNKPVFSQAVNSSVSLRDKCSPYTVVSNTPGSEDENMVKFPFGCGASSDGVTAAENLIQWWKLTEDPSGGEVVDYGTSATEATNLTVVDASTATGPTNLGSPTVFSFDGVNDIVKTEIIDGDGYKNSIADLMDSNYYTITFWMKDNGVAHDAVCWTNSGYWTSDTLRDGGQGFAATGAGIYVYWRPAWTASHWLIGFGTTGWKHYAIVTDLRVASGDDCVGIGYVDGVANPDGTLNDGNPHYSSYGDGVTNYWFSIGGLANHEWGDIKFAPVDVCDFRMYDRVLTPGEISDIAAGDW